MADDKPRWTRMDTLSVILLALLVIACAIAFVRNPQSIMGGS